MGRTIREVCVRWCSGSFPVGLTDNVDGQRYLTLAGATVTAF